MLRLRQSAVTAAAATANGDSGNFSESSAPLADGLVECLSCSDGEFEHQATETSAGGLRLPFDSEPQSLKEEKPSQFPVEGIFSSFAAEYKKSLQSPAIPVKSRSGCAVITDASQLTEPWSRRSPEKPR